MKVRIEEYYDGFAIIVGERRWAFDQGESIKELENALSYCCPGADIEYEEVY